MDFSLLEPITVAKTLAFTILLYVSYQLAGQSRKRYPPGPRGYPIIGNLFDLPKRDEWVAYKEMSSKYNSDIIHLNVFGSSIVVVNSLEVAQDLFDKRSSIYSDRPRMPMLNELIGFDWHFAFMPYGELWKERRKLFHKEFTPPATLLHRPRELEATRKALVKFLDNPDGDYLSKFRHLSSTIILGTAYGIDVQNDNDPYVNVSERAVYAITQAGNIPSYLVDQIPALKYIPEWFPGGNFKKQAREWREYADATPTLPLKYVKDSMADGTARSSIASRLISTMEEEGSRTPENELLLRDVLGSIYVAGSDTTTAVLENFVLAMVQNPEILKKGQSAVDAVVGSNRLPDFSDQDSIPYVDALLKESLRWRPITPLAAPHCLTTDDEYQGYHIPAGSIVVGNSWAMLHDEVIYGPDTHLFNPERFLTPDGKVDPEVKHPEMLFGFGRRQCPGMDMAESSIWMTIASLLACFDIVKAVDRKGRPIEPVEEYSSGMVCRPQLFKCSIQPRSPRVETLVREALQHETF
ncbi:cytochrome P450 [Rhodocollybia butyracea]|uniref:Cytochrome P450 n=1 Tax=Rhodocollybia butyracea TaxID=206335 RepID=A0A9P5U1K0_9AGAR|nr:cytochrome P450 [Rhodocollybia butyracea]